MSPTKVRVLILGSPMIGYLWASEGLWPSFLRSNRLTSKSWLDSSLLIEVTLSIKPDGSPPLVNNISPTSPDNCAFSAQISSSHFCERNRVWDLGSDGNDLVDVMMISFSCPKYRKRLFKFCKLLLAVADDTVSSTTCNCSSLSNTSITRLPWLLQTDSSASKPFWIFFLYIIEYLKTSLFEFLIVFFQRLYGAVRSSVDAWLPVQTCILIYQCPFRPE